MPERHSPESSDGRGRDNSIDPPYFHPNVRATGLRAPKNPLISLKTTLSEVTGPVFGHRSVADHEQDLTQQHAGDPIGQRIILYGHVRDSDGRGIPHALLEIWQANAAGRYVHKWDPYNAPLDPNFSGVGRCLTNEQGRYQFVTIRPGPYPFPNHHNAWRPAHIHFSVFGRAFTTRLITQMYFPDDPLLAHDPIFNAIPDASARRRATCEFDLDATVADWANAFRFDIVLRGPQATPMER
jgi:protocatechuate 3,4-dioxygenase beta subunit